MASVAAMNTGWMNVDQTWLKLAMGVVLLAALAFGAGGCDKNKIDEKTATIAIKDRVFTLDLAIDNATRTKGLGGRTEIKPEGGMLFAFTRAETLVFVMRDCPIDIDVIFLDQAGRIQALHAMKAEPPRTEEEKVIDPRLGVNVAYENRLKKYSSRFPAMFAIELKGGTLEQLKLKVGEKIPFDWEGLKKRAK